MKTKICFIILCSIISINVYSQIPGSPLHVSGTQIRDVNNNLFTLKSVNLNDYMEHSYNPWGMRYYNQTFLQVLSWMHTQDDYRRIKRMGFNSVRVNICPSHINELPNLQRIKEHIKWAKQDSLYVILAYFAPPGSDTCYGYYSERNFYLNQDHQNNYKQQWGKVMKLCKDSSYTHVLYEFLNEPQIGYSDADNYCRYSSYAKRVVYKNLMNDLLDSLNSKNDGNRVVILDGLSFAKADYRGFNYLNKSINHHNNFNIVYSFHYYMDDFAFRGCNWNIGSPYRNYTGFSDSNQGWDTVQFNFNVGDLQGETRPDIALSPYDQRGTYKIRYFEIKDNSNNQIILSLDLLNKQITQEGNERYILDPSTGRKHYLCYLGNCGSAVNSNMYIINNNSLCIRNTVKQDTNLNLGNNWAVLTYNNATWNNQFTLNPSTLYTFKIVVDGDSLDDNGGFTIQFKQNNNPNIVRLYKEIRNLTYGNTSNFERILTSHTDRINSSFEIMNNISQTFNVPIYLGEFGIPIAQREPNTYTYFRKIMNKVNEYNFSWAYFDYREPHENNEPIDSTYITFGLFSGRDTISPTATVCKIVNGIGPGITSYTLGPPYYYYYNKSLIDTLTRILNGTFIPTCNLSGIENLNGNIPGKYFLYQNYPNPFNPVTELKFDLPKGSFVELVVYDLLGKEVIKLVNQQLNPGSYKVNWDAGNYSSGVYFYKLIAGEFEVNKKMILIK